MTTEARPALPYWRLSAFYLCYFAILGAMVPYWTVFLRGRGMSALEIGQLMAVGTLTRILAPWASAWVGDRMPRRIVVVRLAAALMTLIFCGMFVARGFWQVALVTAAFGFFWNAALPQFEIVTLRHLGSTGNLYGRIRLWGSVGFIGVVLGGGWLLERSGLDTLLLVLLATMAGTLISSLLVPDRPGPPAVQERASLRGALRSPAAVGFLAAAFLMQASHGPYYGFFSILLEDQGYTRSMVGGLWALGVVAEVGVFLALARLLPRIGASRVFMASLLLAALRWLLIGHGAGSLAWLLPAQLLHAATFGAFHVAALAQVQRFFPAALQGRGQALYSGLCMGGGGALGGVVSGFLWDSAGAVRVYELAALTALLAAGLWAWLNRPVSGVANPAAG
ncbi:MFS transporter [Immundisolibacter sp.]|uniref:MFS transporter n=1 Tax=Immundisolibacter sp. TaxID=1934948 RepID=UPI002B1A9951|nr:MFS transporter [Immundisolibacter sp.]MEA3219866.1 putative 3-phenylpropionic acid transporter [Immundisolibacter sp.]